MAKLLLKDHTVLCRVKEREAQAVSNILSVSSLCLFCVSTAECGGTQEGKGGEDRGRESQFSEDLQTLLLCQLCLAAL